MTVTRAHRKIFTLLVSCSYLLASTSCSRPSLMRSRAVFMLQAAMLMLAPMSSTIRDRSVDTCLITDINRSISFSSKSYSFSSLVRNDSPWYFQVWICSCRCITSCWDERRMCSYFMVYSLRSMSSGVNTSRKSLTFARSLSIFSDFSSTYMRLFCLLMKEACSLWKSMMRGLRSPTLADMMEALRDCSRLIEASMEPPSFSMTLSFSSKAVMVLSQQKVLDFLLFIESVYI